MKPVLMIHRINDSFYNHPLSEYTLTFDDGYIDHYTSFPKFKNIATEKIYFIVPNWVGSDGFMSLAQVKEISSDPLVRIGCHGFAHTNLNTFTTLTEKIEYVKSDTENMCQWFLNNLGYIPTCFCYPGNNALYGVYQAVLRNYGFNEFYGNERINIERLDVVSL